MLVVVQNGYGKTRYQQVTKYYWYTRDRLVFSGWNSRFDQTGHQIGDDEQGQAVFTDNVIEINESLFFGIKVIKSCQEESMQNSISH